MVYYTKSEDYGSYKECQGKGIFRVSLRAAEKAHTVDAFLFIFFYFRTKTDICINIPFRCGYKVKKPIH